VLDHARASISLGLRVASQSIRHPIALSIVLLLDLLAVTANAMTIF